MYANVGLDFALSDKASMTLHAGMTEFMDDAFDDASYVDYAITFGFGDLYVMVSDTDIDDQEPTFTVGYGWSFDDIL